MLYEVRVQRTGRVAPLVGDRATVLASNVNICTITVGRREEEEDVR